MGHFFQSPNKAEIQDTCYVFVYKCETTTQKQKSKQNDAGQETNKFNSYRQDRISDVKRDVEFNSYKQKFPSVGFSRDAHNSFLTTAMHTEQKTLHAKAWSSVARKSLIIRFNWKLIVREQNLPTRNNSLISFCQYCCQKITKFSSNSWHNTLVFCWKSIVFIFGSIPPLSTRFSQNLENEHTNRTERPVKAQSVSFIISQQG